ncbi:hypothetical protein HDU99_002508, partial [Rhizoclosmatium hyalinum]
MMDIDSIPAKPPSTTHTSQFNLSALVCEEFNQALVQSLTDDLENSMTIIDSTATVEVKSGNLDFGTTTWINMLEKKL